MKKVLLVLTLAMAPPTSFAWDGYDYEDGTDVTIESGNLVREGEEIEVYNWNSGEYEYKEVESIRRTGSTVEIETYDYESGEYKYYEMED